MAQKPTYAKRNAAPRPAARKRGYGFTAMSGLIQTRVKGAGEKRGFAVMRLLTHWEEIVGPDMARLATPVKMGYGREGFGATLTILVTGANAPMVQMQLPQIRERVNGCYGYAAVSRVAITQTAPVGFHEGRTPFDGPPKKEKPPVTAEVKKASADLSDGVEDEGLRQALDLLARNVLSRKDAPERN